MLFKELSDASFYWTDDGHAKKFFNGLKFEEEGQTSLYQSLSDMYNTFDYLYKKYRRIGSTINVKLEERDNILAKFNKCINETSELISLYKHLDVSYCPYERALIKNQIVRLTNLKNQYTNTKEIVKTTMDNIEEIEAEIRSKIGAIDITKINDFNYSLFFKEN